MPRTQAHIPSYCPRSSQILVIINAQDPSFYPQLSSPEFLDLSYHPQDLSYHRSLGPKLLSLVHVPKILVSTLGGQDPQYNLQDPSYILLTYITITFDYFLNFCCVINFYLFILICLLLFSVGERILLLLFDYLFIVLICYCLFICYYFYLFIY